jgi:hypothetical protein
MAAKKAVAKEPITIRLTYNPKNGTVASTPPSPVHFKKGDLVQFVSGRGDEVYVELNGAYKPSVFTPQSGPVKVIAAPTGKTSPAKCGIVTKKNGKKIIYGWVPSNHLVPNVTHIPLPTGIETEP